MKYKIGDRILWKGPNFKGTICSIVTKNMFLVHLDKDLNEENPIPIPFYTPTDDEIENITYKESFQKVIDE